MSLNIYQANPDSVLSTIPYVPLGKNAYFHHDDLKGVTIEQLGRELNVSPDRDIQQIQGLRGEAVTLVKNIRRAPQGKQRVSAGVRIDEGALVLHAGVTALAAPADVGKTPIAQYIAESVAKIGNAGIVFWGEPFPGFLSQEEELALLILEAIRVNDVVIVDSFKDMARNAGGTTMSDGLSSYFFTLLSQWSAHYASYGKHIVTPVNFATSNAAAVASAVQSMKSNGVGTIYCDGPDKEWQWSPRPGVGVKRQRGSFRVVWSQKEGGGVQKLQGGTSREEGDDAYSFYDLGAYVEATPDALARATQRTLKNSK